MTQGATAVLTPPDDAWGPFPIPGQTGTLSAAFLNTDLGVAPFVALLKLGPRGVPARHSHTETVEAVYVVEGTMINEGVALPAGSILTHGPGVWHGPYGTETGCTLMFIQSPGVRPADPVFA